jgi:hypothetical protein
LDFPGMIAPEASATVPRMSPELVFLRNWSHFFSALGGGLLQPGVPQGLE